MVSGLGLPKYEWMTGLNGLKFVEQILGALQFKGLKWHYWDILKISKKKDILMA